MLELRDVKKSYRRKQVVNGISFQMEDGDVLGFIGPNGAGKSTTISMIATLVKPDEGDILYNGVSVVKTPSVIRKELGYVPQDIALYENLSGIDNLKFWGRSYHLSGRQLEEAMTRAMDVIRLSADQLKQKVCTYSGGMKRRLNIAVALLHSPKILLMDEPTVGLDILSRKAIIEAIKRINRAGVSVIYTGHYFEEIEEICNKVAIIREGSIIAGGRTKDLLNSNMNLEQYYLMVVEGQQARSYGGKVHGEVQ